jgi:uncharacterized membrane protein YoaK (UPF0700 family)
MRVVARSRLYVVVIWLSFLGASAFAEPTHRYISHGRLFRPVQRQLPGSSAEKGETVRHNNFQSASASSTTVETASTADRQQRLSRNKKLIFLALLAILCGATDVIFWNQYECYAHMMTGNSIKFATALARGDWQRATKFAELVVSYMAGSGLFQRIKLHQPANEQSKESSLEVKNSKLMQTLVPVVFGIFAVADVFAYAVHPSLFLPTLAVGFGLFNTATLYALGIVTNAVTGHVSKIGMGGSMIMSSSTVISAYNMLPAIESLCFFVPFVASITLTTKICDMMLRSASFLVLTSRVPPLGLTLGSLYALVLAWYYRPPHQ